MQAERLREKISKHEFPIVHNVTVSIGVAECITGETFTEWFQRADAALYEAKKCGRNRVHVAPGIPQRVGIGEKVSANFVQLVWHKAYDCGHDLINAQHRGLFSHANNLLTGILTERPKDEIFILIDVLVRDIVQHFHDEEQILKEVGFPGAIQHSVIHNQLVERAVTLVGRFHAETLGIGELFQFLAHNVVAKHMLGADREFFPYLEPDHT